MKRSYLICILTLFIHIFISGCSLQIGSDQGRKLNSIDSFGDLNQKLQVETCGSSVSSLNLKGAHALLSELLSRSIVKGQPDPFIVRSQNFSEDLCQVMRVYAEASLNDLSETEQIELFLNASYATNLDLIRLFSERVLEFGYDFMKNKVQWNVNMQALTLHQLEREVLLGYGDIRLLFATPQLSEARPFLKSRTFSSESLDSDLNSAMDEFIKVNSTQIEIDTLKKVIILPTVFKDYLDDLSSDFTGRYSGWPDFVATHHLALDVETKNKLRNPEYKWTLIIRDKKSE